MSPRPNVSTERKSQILDAAARVFARLGLDRARMDDIVKESGLSKGALYWYFKSKDDIIVALLVSVFEQELADLRALPEDGGSARERLEAFTEQTIANLKPLVKLMPVLYEFYALALRNKAVRKALKIQFEHYMELMEPLIEQGIQQGEFGPVDVREAAIAAGAIVEGTLLLWVFAPNLVRLDAQLRAGMGLFLDGLSAHVGEKESQL